MVPLPAHALLVTIDFNMYLTGTSGYTWTPFTVATMTLEDTGSGEVTITLDHHANTLTGTQKITSLWFGMDPLADPLNQSGQTPANIFDGPIDIEPLGHNGIGAGYNFELELLQNFFSGGGNSFDEGMSASFKLSGSGVDVLDFMTTANGDAGFIHAALHFQGIDFGTQGASVKVGGYNELYPPDAVPEPASMALAGFGAMAAWTARRKLKAKK